MTPKIVGWLYGKISLDSSDIKFTILIYEILNINNLFSNSLIFTRR